jgi:prepilin peptidase CpaA
MGWEQVSIALLGVLALLLISAAVEDIRIREIADWKNIAIAAIAPLFWWSTGYQLWPDVAIQLGIGLAVFGVFTLAFMIGQMGGGDVKMLGALALWFPWQPLLNMLMIMAIAGGVLTILLVVERKIRRKSGQPEIPYGVAIAFAGLISIHQPILNHFG